MTEAFYAVVGVLMVGSVVYYTINKDEKEKLKREKQYTEERYDHLQEETIRQEAVRIGVCPICFSKRIDNSLNCQCSYQFIPNSNCDVCGNVVPKSQLKSRNDVDLNSYYYCQSCSGEFYRRY